MNKKINEIGNSYGRLSVTNPAPSRNSKAYWLCRCDCGNEHTVMGKLLRAGKVKSCGCWLIDNPSRKLPGNLGAQRRLFREYKKSAKERDLEFDLLFIDFITLIEAACHYCSARPNRPHYQYSDYLYSGVDRKDNSKGYILKNCVSCCWECNKRKLNTDYKDFIDWIQRVANCVL